MSGEITVGGVETKDLVIDNITERTGVDNYAEDEEIAKVVKDTVQEYVEAQTGLLQPYFDELEYYDYMFRCGRSAEKKAENKPMKEPEEARSNVGASMYFRQVMQSAGKIYSMQNARDRFFDYSPLATQGVPYSAEDGRLQAEQMNTLAKWSFEQMGFDEKLLMPLDLAVPKNGIALIGVEWNRKSEVRTFTVAGEPDEVTGVAGEPSKEEIELLTKNHPVFKNFSVRSARFDPNIEEIQDQECFSIVKVIGLNDAIQFVQQGFWSEEAFALLTSTHRWDGTSGNEARESEADNSDMTNPTNDQTGKFLHWRTWINLPIEEGNLDERKNIPKRFVCEFLGNSIDDSICMRIERNDDPDDEIPFQVIHDYPDEEGRMFHISKGHVLKNNYAVETTTINQMVDNVSLVNNPATIERKNAVTKRPARLGRGSRFVVKSSVTEDMRELAVGDRTQTSLGLLDYIKEDSKMAIHTDPAQMGEGLGSRASATEASGVMRLSAAPSVMNAKYVTKQSFSWIGRKMASYWKAFSLPEQVVQITDTASPIQDLRPSLIHAEFDVIVDVVDKVVDDIVEENKISQDLKMISESKVFAGMVDVKGMLEEYFIRRYKRSFVSESVDFDAREAAIRETATMLSGKAVTAQQEQNHEVHLKVKRAERIRYKGLEAETPAVQLLDNNIEQHVQMMGEGQGQQQAEAPPPAEPQGGAGEIPADQGSAAQEAVTQ